MRKNIYRWLGLVVSLGVVCGFVWIKEAAAEVNVNVNFGPPAISVLEPQEVVLLSGSRVYFAPYNDVDVFFYNGYWWSPRGKQWYRAQAYNGPWRVISRTYVPASVYGVPKNYRSIYQKEKHIPYGQFKKQWNGNKQDNKQGNKQDKNNGHGRNK